MYMLFIIHYLPTYLAIGRIRIRAFIQIKSNSKSNSNQFKNQTGNTPYNQSRLLFALLPLPQTPPNGE